MEQNGGFHGTVCKKGALLGLEGRIQTRNYDDKDGKRVYITEVVANSVQLLESKKDAQSEAAMQNDEYDDYVDGGSLPF